MKTNILAHSLSTQSPSTEDVELSSFCPCCGVSLSPDILYVALVEYENEEENNIFILNFCPSCNECFISKHPYDNVSGEGYCFKSASPMTHFHKDFSKAISDLSPDFVSIYNESLQAEELGLDSICGMGYRKSLEFLLKDYIIHKNPSKRNEVSTKMLMACINDYIDDDRLKSLAKASAWLGNDETHYTKKHAHFGTEKLKTFINAFVTFIDSNLAYEEALQLINS